VAKGPENFKRNETGKNDRRLGLAIFRGGRYDSTKPAFAAGWHGN
jgi:hypothetical protein